jgi:hypothetical protein
MDTRYAPVVEHEGLDVDSIGVYVDALIKTISAGAVIPTKEIQSRLLDKLNLPKDNADAEWDRVTELQEKILEQEAAGQPDSAIPGEDPNPAQTGALEDGISKSKENIEFYEVRGDLYYRDGDKIEKL